MFDVFVIEFNFSTFGKDTLIVVVYALNFGLY